MRFLWDLYDAHSDADGDTMEAALNFSRLYNNMASYPSGVDFEQIDEPWSNTNYNVIDNNDGRGATSYSDHYTAAYGVGTSLLRTDNCSPF